MHFSNLALMAIPALVMASPPVLNMDPQVQRRAVEEAVAAAPQVAASIVQTIPTATPAPTSTQTSSDQKQKLDQEEGEEEDDSVLELRQAAGNDNLGTTQAATQAAYITSYWVQTNPTDDAASWSLVRYTQTFASPVTQELTAGAGSVGLGTIVGTVGVVKERSSDGGRVMPVGTLMTAALGAVGVVLGMGLVVVL